MNYSNLYLDDLTQSLKSVPSLNILSNSNVLITGGTGLIGSSIVDMLIVANDVYHLNNTVYIGTRSIEKAKARFCKIINRNDVFIYNYNVENSISSEYKFDFIIHAASPANPKAYASNPVETMRANIIGLMNILEYAKNHLNCHVCFVSSSEVYGKSISVETYSESDYEYLDILNPRACYPSSKRAAETLMASYSSEYGVLGTIVRPAFVYGPTMSASDCRAASAFFYDVIEDNNIVMKSAGKQVRSYCYVPDAASAILSVIINGEVLGAYNIGNPNSVASIFDFADTIARCSGKEICFETPTEIERNSYNLMDNTILNISKLMALGWKPIFDLKTGVQHTIDIMRNDNV